MFLNDKVEIPSEDLEELREAVALVHPALITTPAGVVIDAARIIRELLARAAKPPGRRKPHRGGKPSKARRSLKRAQMRPPKLISMADAFTGKEKP
jgi:hypothetical protein